MEVGWMSKRQRSRTMSSGYSSNNHPPRNTITLDASIFLKPSLDLFPVLNLKIVLGVAKANIGIGIGTHSFLPRVEAWCNASIMDVDQLASITLFFNLPLFLYSIL
ncbi:hypothetical protein SDJN02_05266, partial [Cucurbita argyrosperma subsp. argyrosperma]